MDSALQKQRIRLMVVVSFIGDSHYFFSCWCCFVVVVIFASAASSQNTFDRVFIHALAAESEDMF